MQQGYEFYSPTTTVLNKVEAPVGITKFESPVIAIGTYPASSASVVATYPIGRKLRAQVTHRLTNKDKRIGSQLRFDYPIQGNPGATSVADIQDTLGSLSITHVRPSNVDQYSQYVAAVAVVDWLASVNGKAFLLEMLYGNY